MIQLSNEIFFPQVYKMWKTCFDDSDEYMNLYFSEKYKDENTLVYIFENKAVASLQVLNYQFSFYGLEISIGYISGACTLPECRNEGYMRELLIAAFLLMQKRNIPLLILIPADLGLYDYYAKYGYEKVFEENDEIIDLKKIIENTGGNQDKAFENFDRLYRGKDFCIQKTKEDFSTIIKDAQLSNFPPKTNVSGMARIIDAKYLLDIFAKKNPKKQFEFYLKDAIISENNGLFELKNGKTYVNNNLLNVEKSVVEININILCRLLFGFQLESLSLPIKNHFETYHPILNLMLE